MKQPLEEEPKTRTSSSLINYLITTALVLCANTFWIVFFSEIQVQQEGWVWIVYSLLEDVFEFLQAEEETEPRSHIIYVIALSLWLII